MQLSWLEHHPVTERLRVRFLGRVHAWVAGSIPDLIVYRSQPVNASLPHGCFSPFLFLSKSKEKKSSHEDFFKKPHILIIFPSNLECYFSIFMSFLFKIVLWDGVGGANKDIYFGNTDINITFLLYIESRNMAPMQCRICNITENGQDIGIPIYYNWTKTSVTSWKNKHGVSRDLPCTLSAFQSENHVQIT